MEEFKQLLGVSHLSVKYKLACGIGLVLIVINLDTYMLVV